MCVLGCGCRSWCAPTGCVAASHKTVGTIDIGTNPSEPTGECGLGNQENPPEPTTPLPSPQYGKAEASEISYTFC